MHGAVCLYAGSICVGGRCVDGVHECTGLAVELSVLDREVAMTDPHTGSEESLRCEGFLLTRWAGRRRVDTRWMPFDRRNVADSERIVCALAEAVRTLPALATGDATPGANRGPAAT